MAAPLPVTLRWIAFSLYCIAWLLFWIATGSNSYRQPHHSAARATSAHDMGRSSPRLYLTHLCSC